MTTSIYIIYKITNTINNKSYIGQTITSLKKRWSRHKASARIDKTNNHFHNAVAKYNEADWSLQEIFICFDRTFLNAAEESLIKEYDTFHNGYNSTSGGDAPINTSIIVNLRNSESKKGSKNPMFKGYYITAFGKLPSHNDISNLTNLLSPASVIRWCKHRTDQHITIQSYTQSDYLKTLGKDVIGKTFREIGFWFEPK